MFLTCETQFVLFLAVPKIFCLANGLGRLTCDVRTLNFMGDVTKPPLEKHRMTFGEGRYGT